MDHDVPARFDGEAYIYDLLGVKDSFVVEFWMRDKNSHQMFPISYKHAKYADGSNSTFKTETLWSQYKPTGLECDSKPIIKFLDGLSRQEQAAGIDEIIKLRRKDKVNPDNNVIIRFTAVDGMTCPLRW